MTRSTSAAVTSASARGTKNENAAGKPWKAGEDGVEVSRAGQAERDAERRAECGERHAFDQHLPNDRRPAHADGPQRRDLAESLAHGDRENRGHEEHRDDEAHGAQDVRELAEVDQSLAEVDDEVGDAVHLEPGVPIAKPLGHEADRAVGLDLHDHDRRTIVTGLAGQTLHDREHGADRRLPARVVEPANDAPNHQPASPRRGDRLRIELAHELDGVPGGGMEDARRDLAQEHATRIGRSEIGAGDDLIHPLRLRLDAIAEQSDERVGRPAEERRAEHGAGHLDVGVARGWPRRWFETPDMPASVSNGSVPLGVTRI